MMGFSFAKPKPKVPADTSHLTEKELAYRERAKNEAKRFTRATDTEFWLAVCFEDTATTRRWQEVTGFGAQHERIWGDEAREMLSRWKPEKPKPGFGAGVGFGAGFNFSALEDPLANVEYGNGLAADCLAEFDALLSAMEAVEPSPARDSRNSGFWFLLVFRDRDDKENFLDTFGIRKLGDRYLDGVAVASKLGMGV